MDIDLAGLVDMHVHSGPDVRPRSQDDIDLARSASRAGLQALLIKSHVTLTADRAAVAEKVVGTVRVFGGLVLNWAVGGLNPAAVEAAIALHARQVWMPTISAANHVAHAHGLQGAAARPGAPGGITVLQEDGTLAPAVREILALLAESDTVLGTGHLSPAELVALVGAARAQGVRRIVVTHPEQAVSSIPLEVQQALALPGVWFEHCYVSTLVDAPAPLEDIAARIRAVGSQHVILTSDLGLAGFPLPVDGLRAFLSGLLALGIPWRDLQRQAGDNPAALLGL